MYQLKEWKVSDLIEYARNPRKNDHAVDKVAAAIREFGFRVPILAKSDKTVVDGHLRLKAAKKLGLETVPVMLCDDMTEAQIKAFRISVNRVAELAGWDDEMLRVELAELEDLGFDLELTGFELDEIDAINLEPIDIEDVDHFNTSFNFSITCEDLDQLALVQSALGATGKKIEASKLLEMLR